MMHVAAIPDDDNLMPQLTQQLPQEFGRPLLIHVIPRQCAEVQPDVLPFRREGESGDQRDTIPMRGTLLDHRRLSAGCQTATHQGRHHGAAFIDQYQMGVAASRPLFIRGQSSAIQRLILASSRSRGRRRGFCGVIRRWATH